MCSDRDYWFQLDSVFESNDYITARARSKSAVTCQKPNREGGLSCLLLIIDNNLPD